MYLSTSRNRFWWGQAALAASGVLLGALLGWLAFRGIDWGRVWPEIVQFPPRLLALALLILIASFYLRALRWRLLWTTEKVSTLRLFFVESAALGLNNLSPIRALDEPTIFGILAWRDRLPGGALVATMMACRIQDLAFTLLFIGISVAVLPVLLQFTPAIVLTSLYFIIWITIMLNLGRLVRRFPALRRIPGVDSFESAMTTIRAEKRRTTASFALTIAYWLLLAPLGWIIAVGVGIDLPFHQVMFAVLGSIFFATAVPGLPSAIGTFEFAVVSLLGLFGTPREPAITFSIILHAVLFVPPIMFAIVVLPREGAGSIGGLKDLIARGLQTRQK